METMGAGWAAIIMIYLACIWGGIYTVISHIVLLVIFNSLLAPIPVDKTRKKKGGCLRRCPKDILEKYDMLTIFLGISIYLVFPVFFIAFFIFFVSQKASNGNIILLLILPFLLCGLIYKFNAVTRAVCRDYPSMIYLLNKRHKKNRVIITKLLISIMILICFVILLFFMNCFSKTS